MVDFKLRYLIDADGRKARSEIAGVDKLIDRVSKRGSTGFDDVLGGSLASSAISKATGLFLEGGKAVLDYSSKLEQTAISMETLMGGTAAANKHLAELRKLSTSTTLEFQSISKMSARLQGAGVDAENVVGLIRDIGNTAAATGEMTEERMEGIGVAISQIFSKGKVSAEEMEQLAERGIPAWRILSQAIGKTVGETRKLAEDGKITSQQFLDAFQKFSQMNFGDAMEKQAHTFSGAMGRITNIAMLTADKMFKPIFDKISRFGDDVANNLQEQESQAKSAGISFGFAIGEGVGAGLRRSSEGPGGWMDYLFNWQGRINEFLAGINKGLSGFDSSFSQFGQRFELDPATNTLRAVGGSAVAPPGGPGGAGTTGSGKKDKLPAFGSMRSLVISSGNPQWDSWFNQMGEKYGVDPNILLLQAQKESRFKAGAVSPKGAQGFMQIMPGTAERFNVNTSSIKDSIRGAAQYMSVLLSMFGGDYRKALAGYNAGEGNVQKYGGIPPFRETRDYVSTIQSQYRSRVRKADGGGYGTYDFEKDVDPFTTPEHLADVEAALRAQTDEMIAREERASDNRLSIRRREADLAFGMLEDMVTRSEITELEAIKRTGQLRLDLLLEEQAELKGQIPTEQNLQRLEELRLEIETQRLENTREEHDYQKKITDEINKQINALQKKNARPGEGGGLKQRKGPGEGTGFLDQLYNATGRIQNMGDVWEQMGNQMTSVFMQMGQGLGAMLESWVLLGDQADVSMKKMVGAVLAGVAAQAATLAIFHVAMGIAALTPWGAAMYGPAPLHFKAAALWGAIAVGTALAGRAVSGDSNKSGGRSSGSSSSSYSSSGRDRDLRPYSRESSDVYISGRREKHIEALTKAVEKLHKKLDTASPGDVLVRGAAQKKGFVAQQFTKDVESNSSLGSRALRSMGAR